MAREEPIQLPSGEWGEKVITSPPIIALDKDEPYKEGKFIGLKSLPGTKGDYHVARMLGTEDNEFYVVLSRPIAEELQTGNYDGANIGLLFVEWKRSGSGNEYRVMDLYRLTKPPRSAA